MEVAMHSLAISRVHIADSNLGMCQRMLEMSLARARDRVTFGKTINTRQAIKMKLADMAYGHPRPALHDHRFRRGLRPRPAQPLHRREGGHVQAVLHRGGEEGLRRNAGDLRRRRLLRGQSPYGPTERLYRDCRALWLEEGSPTIQRITIARELERHDGVVEYPALDWIAGTDL